MTDRVTVGLPVFNGMPYLPEAMDSLIAQDHSDLEIIISDNASTDGTEEYCRALAARDSRVSYHRNRINVGAAANFSRCRELATSDYFAWAAHDDRYHPAFVALCLASLINRPEAGLCVPAHRMISRAGEVRSVITEPEGLGSSDLATRLRAHLWRRGWFTIYGLWRTATINEIGAAPAVWGGDVVLIWRALLRAPVVTVGRPLTDYRVLWAEKTADAIHAGVAGTPCRLHFPHTRMIIPLRQATAEAGLTAAERAVANEVLRRWRFTRHYRELLVADLWIEVRRMWSEGKRVRPLALLVPMALMGPHMAWDGAQRLRGILRSRRS